MAKSPNFTSILDKPSEDAERPKPMPAGTYQCVIKGMPEFGKSDKKQTDYARFTLQPLQADEDVDQEELDAAGGLATRTVPVTFYITENSEYRLREFLDQAGVPARQGKEKLSHRQRSELANGHQIGIFIKHKASEDGQAIYAEVARTFALE